MNFKWIAIATVALVAGSAMVAQPADARAKHAKQKVARCADRPDGFSWPGVIFNPAPQPNGCAPAVYQYGRYVGQDPDPFIRQQLLRDPQSGYTQY